MDRTSEPGAIVARKEPRSGPVHPMHPGGSCAAAHSLRSTNRTPVGSGAGAGAPSADRLEVRAESREPRAESRDRFTTVPEAGFGMSEGHREYSLGLRFVRDRRGADLGSLELSLETTRRESANDDTPPEHTAGLRLTARW